MSPLNEDPGTSGVHEVLLRRAIRRDLVNQRFGLINHSSRSFFAVMFGSAGSRYEIECLINDFSWLWSLIYFSATVRRKKNNGLESFVAVSIL